MWIFQNNSFLSVVQHKDKEGVLLVRSRIKGDIEAAIPGATVFEIADADYRYRAEVPREVFKEAMAQAVDRIDYNNFKNSVSPADKNRKRAYMDVWAAVASVFGAFGKDPERDGK